MTDYRRTIEFRTYQHLPGVAMTRRAVVIACISVVMLVGGCSGNALEKDLPPRSEGSGSDGSTVGEIRTAGQLAATATHVVHGEVKDVEQGAVVRYSDGSGRVVTPRVLLVQVDEYLFSRDDTSSAPSQLRVLDGYWEGGEGFGNGEVAWLQPGDVVTLFVSRDIAPDGSLMDTYTPLGSEGRVLLDMEDPAYDSSDGSVWAHLGQSASAADLQEAIARAVNKARSGEARPVLTTVCYPSDPGNEESEPMCREV